MARRHDCCETIFIEREVNAMRRHWFFALALSILAAAVVAAPGAAAEKPQPTATRAPGPDLQAVARQIVNESVRVREEEGVLISGDASKIPLMEAIAVEVAKAGGFPHLVLESPAVEKRILTEAPLRYLQNPNKLTLAEIENVDVQVTLSPVEDPATLANVPEERVALARKANQAVIEKVFGRPVRIVGIGNPVMPTPAIARFYGVPPAEFERRFWDAVNTPHSVVEEHAQRVKEALESGREIRLRTQAGTDLQLRLAGKTVLLNDGQIHETPEGRPTLVWLPAGEVYTTPEVISANGTVVVPLAVYRGIRIRNLRVTFEGGRVTQIQAAQNANVLREALANASGDKDRISMIDIGVNPNSKMIPNSDYCSFEMAGMVSIGIGAAPWAGSPNQSDLEEAFFIPRATVEVDGRVIVRDGKLQI